ncbi:MAG: hypothetical protein SGPRY_014745, partial [Prymnesium sp.]
AVYGPFSSIVCGPSGLFIVDGNTGVESSLTLPGASSLEGPTAALALNEGKLLVAHGEAGEVTCLEEEKPAAPLLPPVGGAVRGMCVTDEETTLLLAVGGGVMRAELDVNLKPSPPTSFLPPSAGVQGLTVDRQGNLYAATKEGVSVFDEQADPILEISLPTPASGCCFGGMGEETPPSSCPSPSANRNRIPNGCA